MPNPNASRTVSEILREKKASTKDAPFPPAFVGWQAVAGVLWDEIEVRAKRAEPVFRELTKLLSDKRFNK